MVINTVLRLEKDMGELSQSRDTVPILLASKGVDLQLWRSTFDGFAGWYAFEELSDRQRRLVGGNANTRNGEGNQNEAAGSFYQIPIIGTSLLCTLALFGPALFFLFGIILFFFSFSKSSKAALPQGVTFFQTFLEQQQEAYEPHGIKISSAGSDRYPTLLFDTNPNQKLPVEKITAERSATGIPFTTLGQELKSLHELHQEGILTDREYMQAKERVIANYGPPNTVHVNGGCPLDEDLPLTSLSSPFMAPSSPNIV